MIFSYLVIVSAVLGSVQPWALTTPRAVLGYVYDGSVTFGCVADVPLAACEVRTLFDVAHQEPVINLSGGKEAPLFSGSYYNASYHGEGLLQGHCGVQLSGINWLMQARVVTCRARAAVGGWKEQQAVVLHEEWAKIRVTSHQPRVVAASGSDVSLLFTFNRPLTQCAVRVPGASTWLYFNRGHASPALGRFRYHGNGLERGECGVTVTSVRHEDSDVVWVMVVTPESPYFQRMASLLIVTAAPSVPDLLLTSGTSYTAGDSIDATCVSRGGVPPANMTWYLGDKVVRSDLEDDLPDLDWKWPWDRKVLTQSLTHNVFAEDDDKEVKCRISHVAEKGIKEVKRKIDVTDPSCGKKGNSIPDLVAGGSDVLIGEYPWHVGIYVKEGNSFSQTCGGTLITPSMVITAAHCFWDKNGAREMNATLFRVGVGKVLRGWNAQEPGAQKVGVEEIVLNLRFPTSVSNMMHDIAVVVLKRALRLTATVNVACVDWGNEKEHTQLVQGQRGIVAGWGLRSDGSVSEALQAVSLPWIPETTCWDSILPERRRYYTTDKFCAGYVDAGVSVCPGDSGGGLLFQNRATGQYFLRGVVSISFSPLDHNKMLNGCYDKHYAGFTRVSDYLDWLKIYRNT